MPPWKNDVFGVVVVMDYKKSKHCSCLIRAKNFRMVDIKINAETPGFTKPEIILIRIRYRRKKYKIQPISVSC